MKRLFGAAALACALAAGGCLTAIDSRIAEISDRLSARCAELQTAALAVDLFAPEKVRAAAAQGQAVLARFCASPPRNAAELALAIAETIRAQQALDAAKRGA